jgi:hypothetical protein
VPLFVKAPGQVEGGVVDGVVRTIDVLPTIARELGIRLSGVDGVPAGTRGSDPATKLDVPDSWERGTTGTYGEFLRQRAERRRYERALLHAADYDPFAIGPHPELIGRRPGAVPASAGRLRLEGTDVWVSGTAAGLAAGTALAVAVDGRVAATTRIDGSGSFGAPVESRGSLDVFEVTNSGGFRKL